MAEFFASGS